MQKETGYGTFQSIYRNCQMFGKYFISNAPQFEAQYSKQLDKSILSFNK